MSAHLAMALLVAAGLQSVPPDRTRAEQLARSGRTADAIALFAQIVEQNPSDVEARLWIARLELRLGRADEAEAGFRAVVSEHPADVDARIGLASALIRKGNSQEALAILLETRRDAGENSDFFGALARAYRRSGDDRLALEYFGRAKALAPSDPDLVAGFEATARAYGHWLAFEGFGEHSSTDSNAVSGTLTLSLRAMDRLHVDASARVMERSGVSTDALGGGGLLWRAGRATTLGVHVVGGAGNVTLPTSDVSGELIHYAGIFDVGGSVRWLSFAGADVVAASSLLSWDPGGRWRLDSRYTFSRSAFVATGESSGDHSVLLRETWRAARRVDLQFAYAYGIESFEDLTAARLGALGATTLAGTVQFALPSLTRIAATWEHQWWSNETTIDRLTLSFVQSVP